MTLHPVIGAKYALVLSSSVIYKGSCVQRHAAIETMTSMVRNVKTGSSAVNSAQKAIYLFCGEDEPARKKALDECVKRLMPEDAMNFESIDAQAESAEGAVAAIVNLRESILTYPFFGEGKVVLWKGVNFLDDSGPGRFASVKEALEKLQNDLHVVDGKSVTLIISARSVHKGRTFNKALLKVAEAQYFDLPDLRNMTEERVMDAIGDRMHEAGLRPGNGATERFFDATGLNTSLWAREIEKLVCYKGDDTSPVTRAEVERMVSGTREVLIWDFCTSVLQGDVMGSLIGLSTLMAQEESEVGVLILLIGQVRLAVLGSILKDEKLLRIVQRGPYVNAELASEADVYLPKKKSGESISMFSLGRAAQAASRRPTKFWIEALEEMYIAQRKMLSGVGDKRRVLEQVVLLISGGT